MTLGDKFIYEQKQANERLEMQFYSHFFDFACFKSFQSVPGFPCTQEYSLLLRNHRSSNYPIHR
jgi:hypothetical protein